MFNFVMAKITADSNQHIQFSTPFPTLTIEIIISENDDNVGQLLKNRIPPTQF